jgi:hypothetical protein
MSNDRRTTLAPSAGTTSLATDFPVLDELDLTVKRTRAALQTTLALDVDYTLSGIGNDGGCFVTLLAASLAGDTFLLDGNSQADRISDYDPEQTPSGDQLDMDLNRLVHLAQENKRDIVDLKVAQGSAPQIELSVQGGNLSWRPVGGSTWTALPGLTYPPHSHVIADTAGLQAVLDAKLPTASFTGHVHANAVAAGAAGFMSGADKTKLDGLSNNTPYTEYDLGAYAASTDYAAAHGLAAYPSFVQFYLQCVTLDHGHAVGTRIPISGTHVDGAGNVHITCTFTTSQVLVYTSTDPLEIVSTANITGSILTFARWRLYARVYS